MHPHSSSTSSSEPGGAGGGEARPAPRGRDLREAIVVAAWTLLFLATGDIAVNRLFPRSRDPRTPPRSQLHTYFNYGWSIESKLRWAIGPTDQTSASLMTAGWVDREVARVNAEPKAAPGDLDVSFYGMSFSAQIGEAMAKLDHGIHTRLLGGPSASANHSYAIYQVDRGGPSQVVVLAVLASTVQGLVTNNGATWMFEGPAPFTYPRYMPTEAGLVTEWPMVRTLDEYRARLADPAGWDAFVAQLRETDGFYNGFLFRHDIGDYSAIVRMVRRAVAQRWQTTRAAQVHGPSGYNPDSPAVASLRGVVAAFAADARRDGKRPVVLLLENMGYRDHLERILEPVLDRDQIAFLSTHPIAPDTDVRNFVADGHFTPEANARIARALLDVIRALPETHRATSIR
jgi:hypothetical protein